MKNKNEPLAINNCELRGKECLFCCSFFFKCSTNQVSMECVNVNDGK